MAHVTGSMLGAFDLNAPRMFIRTCVNQISQIMSTITLGDSDERMGLPSKNNDIRPYYYDKRATPAQVREISRTGVTTARFPSTLFATSH